MNIKSLIIGAIFLASSSFLYVIHKPKSDFATDRAAFMHSVRMVSNGFSAVGHSEGSAVLTSAPARLPRPSTHMRRPQVPRGGPLLASLTLPARLALPSAGSLSEPLPETPHLRIFVPIPSLNLTTAQQIEAVRRAQREAAAIPQSF